VILSDPHGRPPTARSAAGATLDALFRQAVLRRPAAVALVDPADRARFTDGAPRRLTYAQADRMVSAIAGRLRRVRLATDAIVGLQTANTVDGVLALLGVLRAGLIAMPLPLLWRRADMVDALRRVGGQALIVSGRVGGTDHYGLVMQVAGEVFTVRHVFGFGRDAPDGVIALDDLYAAEDVDPVASIEHARAFPPGPDAHLAVITWDVTAEGLVPVARSHAELIAGGQAVALEGQLEPEAGILTTLALSSFAGLAVAMVPWLLVGGTLTLHHPFDAAAFAAQSTSVGCDVLVIPGSLAAQFADAGLLSAHDRDSRVLAVWRAPERLAHARTWRNMQAAMIDVQVFGETGLIVARRGADGKPAAVPFGAVLAPRAAKDATLVGEVMPTPTGTVALRGAMVPGRAFPPGAERTALPFFKVAANGFVDTGYACRVDPGAPALVVTAPPPGVVSVGGYRFVTRDLQEAVRRIDGGASLAVLPDAFAGQRLAGSAADPAAIRDSLAKLGVNPLLVNAFGTGERRTDDRRSA
jgi:acyl-CoA synthetase (AMP-forming)/AMP-acid ligase II